MWFKGLCSASKLCLKVGVGYHMQESPLHAMKFHLIDENFEHWGNQAQLTASSLVLLVLEMHLLLMPCK